MNETKKIFAATIGLDWADKKHDLWLQPAQGGTPEHIVLPQKPEALHGWIAELRARFPDQPVAIALETSRGPVLSALLAYDFITVFPVNPNALSNYRNAFRVSGAKDDRSDARLLEQYLRCHQDQLKPLSPDTELTRRIGALAEKRRGLIDHRTGLVNELHAELKMYFPLAEILLGDLTVPMAAAFLKKWPTLEALQKSGPARMRNFFYAHNCRSSKLMETRVKALQEAKALTTDPALIGPSSSKVLALVAMLQALHPAIASFDQQIKEAMDAHPDAPIFRSLPGAGPALAPRLLAAFGTQRDRFATAQEVQQLFGLAPVRKASGQSESIHMRHHCPTFGRQSFHENAAQALKTEAWAGAYYQQQRKGHKHHSAVRALAFKLIRVYFACWKNKTVYSSKTYEDALRKHGTTLLAKPANN